LWITLFNIYLPKFNHKKTDKMDIYDEIANEEFGMDFEQLGSNEKDWVMDEIENAKFI